jgi:hypothetical protein
MRRDENRLGEKRIEMIAVEGRKRDRDEETRMGLQERRFTHHLESTMMLRWSQ